MADVFNLFNKEAAEDKYFLVAEKKIAVYSNRSFLREAEVLKKKLAHFKKENKKLLYAAPYHEKIGNQLKNFEKNLIWFSMCDFSKIGYQKNFVLLNNQKSWEVFIRDISANDKFEILFHPSLVNLNSFSIIKNFIEKGIKKAAVRLKTISHFKAVWEYNFKRNKQKWMSAKKISKELKKPNVFILGGPSVDEYLWKYKNSKADQIIWCADTALGSLHAYNIIPDVVFSVDSGYGSYEHFAFLLNEKEYKFNSFLVLDALSFPLLFDINAGKTYSYASSHPLVQECENKFDILFNETNDVYGLMKAVFEKIYPNEKKPGIIGHDQKAVKKVTHLQGSAYHRRFYFRQNRFLSIETSFLRLSFRY
ncbi:MAG: DUF115 domain-containing protein [Spirochaetia bacterium]|nr:DUF115 domain-containing protein [Spirochaetia bacterium]